MYLIFAWIICIASQVLFNLSSKREKGLWTWVGRNSPPVSTKGHTRVGFCGRGAPGYEGTFGYKEGATDNSGVMRGGSSWGASFSWLSVPCRLTFRAYNNPILQTELYLLVRRFGHGGSLFIFLVFCGISLAAGWYCNLNSHPQASVPCLPEDTVVTQWHKRILSNFSLELEDQAASSYQACISRASVEKWFGYFPSKSDDWEEKKKEKKTNRPSVFIGDFLRCESFWSLSYPVLLHPDIQESLGQGADPQAGWGVTVSWRSNP